jgi:hypothetical protein
MSCRCPGCAGGVSPDAGVFALVNDLRDPRDPRGRRYPLGAVLLVALCALACRLREGVLLDRPHDRGHVPWTPGVFGVGGHDGVDFLQAQCVSGGDGRPLGEGVGSMSGPGQDSSAGPAQHLARDTCGPFQAQDAVIDRGLGIQLQGH